MPNRLRPFTKRELRAAHEELNAFMDSPAIDELEVMHHAAVYSIAAQCLGAGLPLERVPVTLTFVELGNHRDPAITSMGDEQRDAARARWHQIAFSMDRYRLAASKSADA